jgi:hypothetical protein
MVTWTVVHLLVYLKSGWMINGGYVLIPLCFGWIGIICFTIAGFSCQAIQIEDDSSELDVFGFWGLFDTTDSRCKGMKQVLLIEHLLSYLSNNIDASLVCLLLCFIFAAFSSTDVDEFNGSFRFGRAISLLGLIVGWTTNCLLASLIIVKVTHQTMLLHIIAMAMVIMAVFSLSLFIGLDTENCKTAGNDCKPRALFATIPAFITFSASSFTLEGLIRRHRIPSAVKPKL